MSSRRSLWSLPARLVLLALLVPPPAAAACRPGAERDCRDERACCHEEPDAAQPGCCAAEPAVPDAGKAVSVEPEEQGESGARACLCPPGQLPPPVERRSRVQHLPGRALPAPGVALPGFDAGQTRAVERPDRHPEPNEYGAASSPRSPPNN
ncbi:MAG: hypothetical protein R6X13_10100 [bacterium]